MATAAADRARDRCMHAPPGSRFRASFSFAELRSGTTRERRAACLTPPRTWALTLVVFYGLIALSDPDPQCNLQLFG